MFVRSGLGYIEITSEDCIAVERAERTYQPWWKSHVYRSCGYMETVRDLMLAGF